MTGIRVWTWVVSSLGSVVMMVKGLHQWSMSWGDRFGSFHASQRPAKAVGHVKAVWSLVGGFGFVDAFGFQLENCCLFFGLDLGLVTIGGDGGECHS
jgi:hypothetical protein